MVTQPTDDGRGAPVQTVAKRPWWSRVSTGQLVMVVAFLAAFLLNLNLVRSRDAVSLVAVAASELVPGQVFDRSDVRFVEIDTANPILGALVTDEQASGLQGQIVTTRVAIGAPISRSFLGDPAAPGALRAISIPVEPEHALGGDLLVAGDTVDVIAVEDGVARYVVVGAQVVGVTGGADVGALAGRNVYSIVVAVDADTALAIAQALQADSIEIVRATGAPPPDVLQLPPVESTNPGSVDQETIEAPVMVPGPVPTPGTTSPPSTATP